MRESCLYGSVRGDRGNPVPYRDNAMRNPSTTVKSTSNGPVNRRLVQLVGSGDPIFVSGRERLAGFGPSKRLGEGLVKVGDEGLDPLLQILL
jgi:hypothetical protein